MRCVSNILQLFCRLSEQEVSNDKTNIYFSKNTIKVAREKLVHLSGFHETANLKRYLEVLSMGRVLQK